MSLINKMLQDLDARGSQAGSMPHSEIKPVMQSERLPLMQIALGVTVVVIAMAIAAFFWLKSRAPGPMPNAPAVLTAAPPKPAAPAQAVVPAPVSAPVQAPAPVIETVPEPVAASQAPDDSSDAKVISAAPAPAPKAPVVVAAPEPERFAPPAPRALPAPRDSDDTPLPVVQRQAPALQVGVGRDMTVAQRAESQYRSAMAALDQGRVSSAIEGLEATL